MERYIFLGVLGFSLIAVVAGIFLMPGKQVGEIHLPWQIEITPEGHSRVFGLEIGRSTLADAERSFSEVAEMSLFESESGKYVVEAYFDSVDISGLRAKVVLVMALSEKQLAEMYRRGERLANMGGGRHKVTLAEADTHTVKQSTFSSLSYIPRHNLDEEVIKKRFGEPAERVAEVGGKAVHWLYPDKGLDIAIDPKASEVLQYVRPAQFDSVRLPLRKQSGAATQ